MNSEIKQKILSAYEEETPDILSGVKELCLNIEQDDCVIDFATRKSKKNYTWAKAAGMVAALVIVSAVSIRIGQGSVQQIETATVSENEYVGEEKELQHIKQVEIYVEPGVVVTADENMNIAVIKADDPAVQEQLDGLDLVGKDIKTALDMIYELINQLEASPETPVTDQQQPTQQSVQPTPQNSQSVEQVSEEIANEVHDEINNQLDNAENIVNGTFDLTNDIVNKTFDTTEEIVDETFNLTQIVIDQGLDTTENVLKKALGH